MDAEVKRWGNGLAVRLPKRELDRLGIKEGDAVDIEVRKVAKGKRRKRISLAGVPILHDSVSDVSERHDEYLYGGRR
ncbi:MAG TPA: AbrB/MazE/SpoVT family DNA-binding domain-containing protein [Candidatus Thermoplasmatota archaeon]|nr:AbrB/MazE/SpoVT family DNA-binding domain-containing protein [Candidatus Thermoplasmatota archaeon]